MAKQYSILVMGALGDTICSYFKKNGIFGQIQSYKKKNPRDKIQVICCSSNSQTHKLFENNPYIDKVHHVPWALQSIGIKERNVEFKKLLKGWKNLSSNNKLPGARFSPPKIFLNKEEQAIAKPIQEKGKYILIHPFTSNISQPKEEEYINAIDTMIDDLGYNVVVVGGSYKKSFQHVEPLSKETFNYERDNLYNLVNKASIRTAVKLAKDAYGYFGTWSAFYCTCHGCPATPMVLCTKNRAATIDLVNRKRFGKNKYNKIIIPNVWHVVMPKMSKENCKKQDERLKADRQNVKQKIIKHLGKKC